ncbi:MAG: hypothetical protein GXO65_01350 [Euryarchaeota archaeon]|nr:hypothetical protein [Euryarchaeota archaeon]
MGKDIALVALAVGVVALYAGIMLTMSGATGSMIDAQSDAMRARLRGEISDAEYTERSKGAEYAWREEVADQLERLKDKFDEVVGIIEKVSPETNATGNLSMVSGNLSEGIDTLRGG